MSIYLNQYQHVAVETAEYQDKMYPIVSLIVEAAELADLYVKPYLRGDDEGRGPPREDVISEAGDVLWNLAVLLHQEGISLSDVAEANMKKLKRRQENGTIQGSGNR